MFRRFICLLIIKTLNRVCKSALYIYTTQNGFPLFHESFNTVAAYRDNCLRDWWLRIWGSDFDIIFLSDNLKVCYGNTIKVFRFNQTLINMVNDVSYKPKYWLNILCLWPDFALSLNVFLSNFQIKNFRMIIKSWLYLEPLITYHIYYTIIIYKWKQKLFKFILPTH